MDIYSIGFTHKTAREFFETLKAKGQEICGAAYEHEPLLAPSEELFRAYRKEGGSWEALASGYLKLLKARKIESVLSKSSFKKKTVLLCSEATPEYCHRRLALEYLQKHWPEINIHHF